MKTLKTKSRSHIEVPVWCDECRVRIAPYEEAVAAGKRTFHQRCYQKTDLKESQRGRFDETGLNFATA